MEKKIKKIIRETLSKNNWGIYFKGEPFQHVPTQDSNNFYKINEVKMISFLDKVHECLLMSQLNKENQWQEKSVNLKEKPTDSE